MNQPSITSLFAATPSGPPLCRTQAPPEPGGTLARRTRAKISTRRIRLSTDNLHALSADGLHEIVLPLAEVSEITVVGLPKQLLCIIAPNRSNRTASCAILGIHPTHESAEWEALDYLSERGFKAQSYAELLQAVRASKEYDIVCEQI